MGRLKDMLLNEGLPALCCTAMVLASLFGIVWLIEWWMG